MYFFCPERGEQKKKIHWIPLNIVAARSELRLCGGLGGLVRRKKSGLCRRRSKVGFCAVGGLGGKKNGLKRRRSKVGFCAVGWWFLFLLL